MTIYCDFCKKHHAIKSLSAQENSLMRVLLLGKLYKSYFCDLLCYYRSTQKWHPDGYYPKTKTQVMYDHDLQTDPQHAHWKPIPWLEDAYKKAITDGSNNGLIVLERESKIVEDAIEQARLDAEEAVASDYPYDADDGVYGDDTDVQRGADFDMSARHASRRHIEA